jgi:hypothetical protein
MDVRRFIGIFAAGVAVGAFLSSLFIGGRVIGGIRREAHAELLQIAPQLEKTLLNMERLLAAARGELEDLVDEIEK